MKPNPSLLPQHLDYLKLPFIQKHYVELAQQSAQQNWDHVEYLRRLVEGEYTERRQRVIERRIKAARFPILKTLEQFRWDWPKKINRPQVQHLFRLEFLTQKANVIFLRTVGLGTMPGADARESGDNTVAVVVKPLAGPQLIDLRTL